MTSYSCIFNNLKRGFTLIELLVTIAIIGVLSSILFVNLQGFRERTRDAIRIKDVRTIQTALELYRTDAGTYPSPTALSCGASIGYGTAVYLQKLPCDPSTNNKYSYAVSGGTYTLFACLENSNDSQRDAAKQAACAKASYTVTSP